MTALAPLSQIRFRPARRDAADAERFCALSNSLYARLVDTAYYEWQFFDTPFPSLLLLALDAEERLAGTYGFQLREAGLAGARIGWAIDIMVAPAHQKQGLFRALASAARREIERFGPLGLCVMANQRAAPAHVHGLGWRSPAAVANFACPTAAAGKGNGHRGPVEMQPIERFLHNDQWPDRWECPPEARPKLFTARTARLLDWRWLDCPRYRYRAFAAMAGDRPAGYLVLKLFPDPGTGERLGDIVDLVWGQPGPEVVQAMLRFALEELRRMGAHRAVTWLETGTVLDEAGRRMGFEDTGQRRYFCCLPLRPEGDPMTEASRWFLTMIESEVY